jgi:hypothetical protein
VFDRGVPLVHSEGNGRATKAGACFRKTVLTRLLEHLPFYLVCWMIALVYLTQFKKSWHRRVIVWFFLIVPVVFATLDVLAAKYGWK